MADSELEFEEVDYEDWDLEDGDGALDEPTGVDQPAVTAASPPAKGASEAATAQEKDPQPSAAAPQAEVHRASSSQPPALISSVAATSGPTSASIQPAADTAPKPSAAPATEAAQLQPGTHAAADPASTDTPTSTAEAPPTAPKHQQTGRAPAPAPRRSIPKPLRPQQQQGSGRARVPVPFPPGPQSARGRGGHHHRPAGPHGAAGRNQAGRLPAGEFRMPRPLGSSGPDMHMLPGMLPAGIAGRLGPSPKPQQLQFLPMPPMLSMNHMNHAMAGITGSQPPSSSHSTSQDQDHVAARSKASSSNSQGSKGRNHAGSAPWSPSKTAFTAPELAGPSLSIDFEDDDDPFPGSTTGKAAPPLPARTGRTQPSSGVSLAHGMDRSAPGAARSGQAVKPPSSLPGRDSDGGDANAHRSTTAPQSNGTAAPMGLAMPPLPGAPGFLLGKPPPKRLADMPPLGSNPSSYHQMEHRCAAGSGQLAADLALQRKERELEAQANALKQKVVDKQRADLAAQVKAQEEKLAKLREAAAKSKAEKAAAAKAASEKVAAEAEAAAQKEAAEQAAAEAAAIEKAERAKAKAAKEAAASAAAAAAKARRSRSEQQDAEAPRANGTHPRSQPDRESSRSGKTSRDKRSRGDSEGRDPAADTAMDEWGSTRGSKQWDNDPSGHADAGADLRALLERKRQKRKSDEDTRPAKSRRPGFQKPYQAPARDR